MEKILEPLIQRCYVVDTLPRKFRLAEYNGIFDTDTLRHMVVRIDYVRMKLNMILVILLVS
jgi:hypothetical protein